MCHTEINAVIHLCNVSHFQVLAVAAIGAVSAEAEADADALYGYYGYPYAYGYATFGGKSAPCVNAANQAVPCAGAPLAYAGYPYGENIVRIIV